MQQFTTIADLKRHLSEYRNNHPGEVIGLVPTMGYLHAGHASLIARSTAECALTLVSIFVNPLQFGPGEDYEQYPRDTQRDLALAESNGADIVFMPSVEEMYPKPVVTKVLISELTDRLCGASRPGHFDGVGTVVSKLFHIMAPDRAYFGLKDAQQVAVISRMVWDLNIPVEVVASPTVREPDGLALSSRNVYLSPAERQQATVLSAALEQAAGLLAQGITAPQLMKGITERIGEAPLATIEYVDVLTFPDLQPLDPAEDLSQREQSFIVALAVRFGRTRLIDNRLFTRNEVALHV